MDITSTQNPRVKHIVKLREDRRQRQKDGLLLVEGFDEIQLAISAGHNPLTLLTAPELAYRQLAFPSAESLTVSRVVFEKMSYRDNPDAWLAVFPIPKTTLESDILLSETETPLVIVADPSKSPATSAPFSALPTPPTWTRSSCATRTWTCGIRTLYAPAVARCSVCLRLNVITPQR